MWVNFVAIFFSCSSMSNKIPKAVHKLIRNWWKHFILHVKQHTEFDFMRFCHGLRPSNGKFILIIQWSNHRWYSNNVKPLSIELCLFHGFQSSIDNYYFFFFCIVLPFALYYCAKELFNMSTLFENRLKQILYADAKILNDIIDINVWLSIF